jgi:hypothetical protein
MSRRDGKASRSGEFMLVGIAVKEEIVGTKPFPVGMLDELDPQAVNPRQVNRMRSCAQRCSLKE